MPQIYESFHLGQDSPNLCKCFTFNEIQLTFGGPTSREFYNLPLNSQHHGPTIQIERRTASFPRQVSERLGETEEGCWVPRRGFPEDVTDLA
jgi:hypothetical protein